MPSGAPYTADRGASGHRLRVARDMVVLFSAGGLKMKPSTRAIIALAMTGLLFAVALSAQSASAPQRGGQAAGADMMAQHQRMMSEMQAGQKKLDDLVASMNAAKDAEKADRIAAVVTEMVAMHKQMMAHMMAMPMMSTPGGMMQRGAGPAPGTGTAADHEQHHPDNK